MRGEEQGTTEGSKEKGKKGFGKTPRKRFTGPGICYECGKEGHYTKDCPQMYAQLQKIVVTAIGNPAKKGNKKADQQGN